MENVFIKKVEAVVENHLKPILENVELKDSRLFQTSMHQMQESVDEKFKLIENVDEIEIESFFISAFTFYKDLNVDEYIQKMKEQIDVKHRDLIEERPEVSDLIELIEYAKNISEGLPFLILHRLRLMDFVQKLAAPMYLIEEIEYMNKDEIRARKVMDAFGSVAENLYKNYIKIIWEFLKISQGKKKINTTTSFGNIYNNLKRELSIKYPHLLENNVDIIRNAAQHYDWWYDYKNDKIVFLDQKSGLPIGKASVDFIYKMIERMYFMAGTCIFELQQCCGKEMMIDKGLLTLYQKVGNEISTKGLKNVDFGIFKEVENHFKTMFAPIGQFEFQRINKPKKS